MSEYLTSPTALGRSRNPFAAYGQTSASYLVRRMSALPPAQRGPVLRAVLDAVDPSLWSAAQSNAAAARRAGVPAPAALERGLAQAMSTGITRDLAKIGQTRRAPAPKSLIGLAVHGLSGMGDVFEELGVIVRDQRGTDPTGPVRPHGGAVPKPPVDPTIEVAQVGPFTFSPNGGHVMIHTPNAIQPAWRDYFVAEIKKLRKSVPQGTTAGGVVTAGDIGLTKFLGFPASATVGRSFFDGTLPLFRVKDPKSNRLMGIYIRADQTVIGVQYKALPTSSMVFPFNKIWDALTWLPAKLLQVGQAAYDAAKAAAKFLADQACKLVNNPAAGSAVAGGAAVAPGVGTAVATGVGIAQQLCAGPAPDPSLSLPIPPPPSSPWLLPVIGGGALLLVLALR